mmetsp:Transcript_61723/g.169811  ORF Transcript_61723/g.169811 Transcript_61723/m.169811 type:complete len:242 (+) Transcript_61723:360-1085(+)
MLKWFMLWGNSFTSSIPTQLGRLNQMTSAFALYSNKFCSDVPTQVQALSSSVTSDWLVTTETEIGTACCIAQSDTHTCAPSSVPTALPTATLNPTPIPTGIPTGIPTPQPTPNDETNDESFPGWGTAVAVLLPLFFIAGLVWLEYTYPGAVKKCCCCVMMAAACALCIKSKEAKEVPASGDEDEERSIEVAVSPPPAPVSSVELVPAEAPDHAPLPPTHERVPTISGPIEQIDFPDPDVTL